MTRALIAASVAMILLGLLVALLLSFTVDVDASSGRIRRQTRIGELVLSERIEDTPFSDYVATILDKDSPARWRRDKKVTLWNHTSPHYQFHGAEYHLRDFLLACDCAGLEDDEKMRGAVRVLEMLKKGNLNDISEFSARILAGRKAEAAR